jgi:hypothetical protein
VGGEIAHVERVDGSPLLDRKCELILIRFATLAGLNRSQDIEAAGAEALHDGVLAGVFVHVQPHFAHRTSP